MQIRVSSSLVLAALLLAGCAMSERTDGAEGMTETVWVFETVAGRPLPDRVRVSMAFDSEEQRVFGRSGCNRYTASYSLKGDVLTIGMAAATKMACPEALMAVEDRFLRMLGGELSVAIEPDTERLTLTAPDGARSTALPAAEGEAD
jgi:heat shock protein HslJ